MVTAQAEVGLRVPFDAAEVRFDRQCVGGYMWFFPSGRTARVGVGVPAPHAGALRGLLSGFLGYLSGAGRIYREGVLSYSGGPVPVGGLPSPVQSGCALLAGDAAGCADPVTGSGIYSAILSGALAGRMASEALAHGDMARLAGYRRALGRVLKHQKMGVLTGRLRTWEDLGALAEKAWRVAEYEGGNRL
jgi:flavin-dependent dehydrogenase